VSLGYKCSYTLDSNAPPSGQVLVSQNYIHKLEQRIQSLEQERPAPPRPPPPHAHVQGPGPPQGQPQQRTPTTTGNTPAGHMSQPVTPFDPAPVFVDQSPAGTNQDHPIDGMGMLLAPQAPHLADQATPREQEVYGPMSGISFHHMLLDRLLPGYWCLTSPSTSVDGLLGPTSDSFVLTKEDLPSRAEADRMFYYFETHTWQVYPFVELAVARRAYDELIESRDLAYMSHQPMTCVLFSAFAVVESIATGSFTNVPSELSGQTAC
jgi:hypothetical protein